MSSVFLSSIRSLNSARFFRCRLNDSMRSIVPSSISLFSGDFWCEWRYALFSLPFLLFQKRKNKKNHRRWCMDGFSWGKTFLWFAWFTEPKKGKKTQKPSCRLQERETNRATRSASSLAPLRRNYRRLGMSRKSFRLLIWKGGEKKSSFAVWSDVCLCSLITFFSRICLCTCEDGPWN